MAGPSGIVGTAITTVVDRYNDSKNQAQTAFSSALDALTALRAIDLELAPVNPTLSSADTTAPQLSLPDFPDLPEFDSLNLDAPAPPNIAAPSIAAPGAVPSFDQTQPDLNLPTVPSALTASAPSDAPTVTDLAVPDAPTVTDVDLPSLLTINLPSAPALNLPAFTGTLPSLQIPLPTLVVNYSEPVYSSASLADVTARVRAMLAGGTGLPPEVEQALFDRARRREDVTAAKAVQEATEDFSSRGFTLPQGELARRVDDVRQRNQDAVNSLSRDILIKATDVEVENLRFSVTQGIALETMLIQHFDAVQNRALDVQKFTAQLALDYFNAQVQYYNASLQGYRTQADVYRTLIEAENVKLEQYRGQIEAQRVVGEINQQLVQLYAARVQAQITRIEVYKGQIAGVQARAQVDEAKLNVFRARVEAFASQVQAKATEYQGYDAAIRGESTKQTAFQAAATAYAERVRGYAAATEAQLAGPKLQIEALGFTVEAYKAQLAGYNTRYTAIAEKTRGIAAQIDALARAYTAQVGGLSAAQEAASRIAGVNLERAKAEGSLSIEASRINSDNANRAAEIVERALEAVGHIAAQLAAGAMSALHTSAGISASGSAQVAGDTNVNYSVDGGASDPPLFSLS